MPSREFRHSSRSGKLRVFSAALAFLLTTGPSLAATLTVNSLADDTNSGDGLVTLREAIIAAVNDTTTDLGQTGTAVDVIDLTNLSGTISLTSPLPNINQTITFSGPGQDVLTIDGGGVHTFLTLNSAANINMTGLTVANCYRDTNGGAVSNQGVFAAYNCTFTGNKSIITQMTVNALGSAIYTGGSASSVHLTDCIISHNVGAATGSGGVLFFAGSAVGSNSGTIRVNRCTFDSNSTLYSGIHVGGGGMGHSLGVIGGGSIELTDSTIKGGYFQQPLSGYTSWGSVYVGTGGSRFTAQGCTWTGNTGTQAVGVYSIASPSFTNVIQLLNCTFAENGSPESGAMFLMNGSARLTLEHCTVVNNQGRSNFPASIEMVNSNTPLEVQISNTVLASADKAYGRHEIRTSSGFTVTTNGYNFISNTGTATLSQPAATYDTTGLTKVSELVNPLANNGGPTLTCSLPDGSVLLDAANLTGFASKDQRGVTRPRKGAQTAILRADIGAYERFDGNLKVTKTVDRAEAAVGNSLSYTLSVTNEHPTEPASGIEVTDVLPPNLQFVSTTNSQFTSVAFTDGVLTAKHDALSPGASVSVTINAVVMPYRIENTAAATQLGFEMDNGDNGATAVTELLTPSVPRVVSFTAKGPNPTNAATSVFQLEFDRDVAGLDMTDFTIVPPGGRRGILSINPVSGSRIYDITASSAAGDGPLGLNLIDNDSIVSVDNLQPLNGFGDSGPFASEQVTIDRTAPVSGPIAAAVSPGETTTTKFFLLYSATDPSGIAGTELFLRKGTSGPFQPVGGGWLADGIYEVDTAEYGGYGTYELYTVATDAAGNIESRINTPQIRVALEPSTPTAAINWHLYD